MKFIFFEISYNDNKLLSANVYRSNRIVTSGHLEEKLEIFALCYVDIIISGDLNNHVLLEDTLVECNRTWVS